MSPGNHCSKLFPLSAVETEVDEAKIMALVLIAVFMVVCQQYYYFEDAVMFSKVGRFLWMKVQYYFWRTWWRECAVRYFKLLSTIAVLFHDTTLNPLPYNSNQERTIPNVVLDGRAKQRSQHNMVSNHRQLLSIDTKSF